MSGGNIYVSTTGGDIDTSGAPQYVLSGDKLILKKTFDDGVSVTVTFKKIWKKYEKQKGFPRKENLFLSIIAV